MSLPFPNERLPFAQLSFQGLVDMYRRATRNYNESNQQVPDLEQYINAVLCGRWPRPAEVRMSLNIRQGLTAPDVDDATITRDLDSLIGISDRLPYTGKLAVFPVPSFRDTLCKDVGIRGNAFVGPETRLVPLHLIPNVAVGRLSDRHILRVFLPAKYVADGSTLILSPEELRAFYNRGVREAVIAVDEEHIAHWPQSIENAYVQYRDVQGQFHFGTIDLSAHRVRAFGDHLLQRIRNLPWGRGAYYVHQLRGTKGSTSHDPLLPHAVADAVNGLFVGMDAQEILDDPTGWWCDVGIEARIAGHVLQWDRNAHIHVLRHALPGVGDAHLHRAIMSQKFQVDRTAQIKDMAGFRYACSSPIRDITRIAKVQAYTTEKAATYQLHKGDFSRRNAQDYYPGTINKTIARLIRIEDVYLRCSGESAEEQAPLDQPLPQQEGSVRLEVRVALSQVPNTLLEFPVELIQQAVLAFKPAHFWQFKYYRVTAIRHLAEYMSRCRRENLEERTCLTLMAILTYMRNALDSRPAEGQAENELVSYCCQQIPEGELADGQGGEVHPTLYRMGIYNIAAIILNNGDARITWTTFVSDRTLLFLFHERNIHALQSNFAAHRQSTEKRPLVVAARAPNRLPYSRAVHLDDFAAADIPNFNLGARGMVNPSGRVAQGRDIQVYQDLGVPVPGQSRVDRDQDVTHIWLQFLSDLLNRAPNRRRLADGSYLLLPPAQRRNVKPELYQRHDLTGIFDAIYLVRVDRDAWDNAVFARFFPDNPTSTSSKRQNYDQCVYFQKWHKLIRKLSAVQIAAVRQEIKRQFDTLVWLPYPTAERIWATKVSQRLEFVPNYKTLGPAPHIVLNPHSGVRDLTLPSRDQVRLRIETQTFEAEERAERAEEEEESSD